MKKFVYYAPTEIVFGKGTEMKAAELVKKYGGTRVLLIYGGHSAVESGLIGRVEKNLEDNGLAVLCPMPLIASSMRALSCKATLTSLAPLHILICRVANCF